jgi:trk system potassium uptake protein TrkH
MRLRRKLDSRKPQFHPARTVILSFLGAILVGWILLSLPQASKGPPLSLVDSLFTATSATCVTGLIVVDTGSTFTTFGQMVILVLIQLGGLGIMTFSALFLIFMGGRFSIRHRLLMQESFSQYPMKDVFHLVRLVVTFTLLIEFLGALFLYGKFLRFYPPLQASYYALFHSISAFCNAGFSLYKTSFFAFQHDLLVNIVITTLIIVGGIGFFVLADLNLMERIVRLRKPRLSLHTKTVILVTGALILLGTVLVLVLEWNNTLSGKSLGVKLLAAYFQSVTSRTAGFNTLFTGQLTNATLFVLVLLMFVGASPGSTGGGIKTSTFGILIALLVSRIRGRRNVELFGRTVPLGIVAKAVSVAALALFTVIIFTLALSVAEEGLIDPQLKRGEFLEFLFEITSAFGTVGLSTGVTPTLSSLGKILVAITIFIGRLGPLTLALAVGQRVIRRSYEFPEENIMVG